MDEINRGRVQVNMRAAKPGRDLKLGDIVDFRQGAINRTVKVMALSMMRGPASVAQHLYEETAASITEREARAEQLRLAPEPAHSQTHGRPTKRNRRDIDRAAGEGNRVVHDSRWTASLGD